MSTVDRATARMVVAGDFPEDRIAAIVAYQNAWGGPAYKLLRQGQELRPSESVRKPALVWVAESGSLKTFDEAADAFERRLV